MELNKIWNIKRLYPYNLIEGEGAGTSYEYVTKALALRKMWRYCPEPKSILIAGLPEIYGLSLDFLLWGKIFGCSVTVVEDRKEVIEKLRSCIKKTDILAPKIILIDSMENIGSVLKKEKTFDIGFSCEVLQRLSCKDSYIKALGENTKCLALFAPNKGNMAHATKSTLKSLSLEELVDIGARYSKKEAFAEGYVDFPPWPPGVKRSDEKREKAEHGFLEKRFLDFCQIWARLEVYLPFKYRYKYSHIVYAFLK